MENLPLYQRGNQNFGWEARSIGFAPPGEANGRMQESPDWRTRRGFESICRGTKLCTVSKTKGRKVRLAESFSEAISEGQHMTQTAVIRQFSLAEAKEIIRIETHGDEVAGKRPAAGQSKGVEQSAYC
jgi:hypothetical protein